LEYNVSKRLSAHEIAEKLNMINTFNFKMDALSTLPFIGEGVYIQTINDTYLSVDETNYITLTDDISLAVKFKVILYKNGKYLIKNFNNDNLNLSLSLKNQIVFSKMLTQLEEWVIVFSDKYKGYFIRNYNLQFIRVLNDKLTPSGIIKNLEIFKFIPAS
jgi:hypothetical protein